MNLVLTIAHRGDYLEVVATGECTLENLYGLIDAVRRASDQHSCSRVLVDSSAMNGIPTDMARFKAGVRAAEVLGGKIRVAVVSRATLVSKFGENAAVNRGANLRMHTDRGEALQWLLQNAATGALPKPQ